MPLFDMKCPKCGKTWEALVVKQADNILLMCSECFVLGEQQISTGTDFKMGPGFAARNNYGLKKFDDGGGKST